MNGRRRVAWVGAVVLLAAVVTVAPTLPPKFLVPVSIGWLGGAGLLVVRALAAVRQSIGPGAAIAVAALGLGGPAWLVGTDWGGRLGTYLPCHRNWTWLPSYLLRSSPTRSATATVGGQRIKICYGSPRARGRRMIGGPAVPFGQLWRTGANEPTTIRLGGPLEIAGLPVELDKVSLYTVPGPETWEAVLNRATHQWGIESEYPPVAGDELGRAVVPSRRGGDYAEELRIWFDPADRSDSADLVLRWESTEVRIPVVARGRKP